MSETRLLLWIAWQVLVVGVVLVVPSYLKFSDPAWAIPAEHAFSAIGLAACSALASALLTIRLVRRRGALSWAEILGIPAASLGGIYLLLLVVDDITYSRAVLLAGSGLLMLLVPLPLVFNRIGFRRSLLLSLVVLLLGGGAWLASSVLDTAGPVRDPDPEREIRLVRDRVLYTGYYTVEAVYYSGYLESPVATGGGIDALDDSYLLVNGDGEFYGLSWQADSDSLEIRELELRVPINSAEFDSDVGERVNRRRFRVTDQLLLNRGDHWLLLVSHHFWKRDLRCFVLRLSALELASMESILEQRAFANPPQWKTVYDTQPCLPFGENLKAQPFDGGLSGGRLARIDSERVLLTVGDHGFDGWNNRRVLSQEVDADYGKTLVVDVATGSAEVFSLGHRNPQGLLIDEEGTIWLTEHGPQGGDELNRLRRGANYGWPFATYGTEYGQTSWPLTGEVGDPEEFELPFYSWLPSIAVSNLISIRGELFQRWREDLLISSLADHSLWRLRIHENRVQYAERVEIGERIRDLAEGRDGRIVLWTDSAVVVSLRPWSSARSGAAAFGQCVGCHRTDGGGPFGIGPDLAGVYGRMVTSVSGYEYSAPLRSVGGRWTDERLDAFLEDPQSFAPGTTMRFLGVKDSLERRALIEHLKTLR